MSEAFHIVEVNPNAAVGGDGCLCSETKDTDCQPPYAVFYVHDMASNASPHPVICKRCAEAVVQTIAAGDVLAGGEQGAVDAEAEELPEAEVPEV